MGILKAIGSVCIFSYLITIVLNTVKGDSLRRAIRLTASLYIMAIILTPLKSYSFDAADLTEDIYDYQAYGEEYVLQSARENLEIQIGELLNSQNISYNRVEVHIIKHSRGAQVESIEVTGAQASDFEAIRSLLAGFAGGENIILGE